ncbi:hypothetical protein C0989_004868 [Termitomyces sp. Mn162]|nr:hypothetical protein C0989_004868 [Termitomyces sp. Mn162]
MIIIFNPLDPDNPLVVHPLQVQVYLDYELEVCQTHSCLQSPFPMGYDTLTSILNLADPETKCKYRLAAYDQQTKTWSKVKNPFPPGLLPTTYIDLRLDLLATLGFIMKQGNVDKQTVEDAVRAWRAPSGEQHSYPVMDRDSLDSGPGPSSTTTKRHTLGSCRPSTPMTPQPPRAGSSIPRAVITAHSVIIRSPDRKGKGKATEEEEEMAVDPVDVPLSANDNDNDEAEGELEDYPNDGAGESSPAAD